MRNRIINYFFKGFIILLGTFFSFAASAQKESAPMLRFQKGKLVYTADSLGNQIPDFSFCGYQSSNEPIPFVPVVVIVKAMTGDATATIQGAINYIAKLPLQSNGFRGALLLEKGHFQLMGRLTIKDAGIVIRGSGLETILEASGIDRETFIRIEGKNDRQISAPLPIQDAYLPVGANALEVMDPAPFKTGTKVFIQRPSTQKWIDALGMNEFGGGTGWLKWQPGQRDIAWERTIVAISNNKLLLDAPITTAIDSNYGGGFVSSIAWPGRIERVGIENLQLQSQYDSKNPKDEDHCWNAISFENIRNGWVRNVNFRHFAGSAVAIFETGSQITVQDCISTDPVSELAGERRNTFFTMGQRTLFFRCYAAAGRHDFSTGFCAPGPNAFVQCTAYLPNEFSGSIDSWASGLLFDNVKVDAQAILFSNLERTRQGAGWNAANSMIWQSTAAKMECYSPPTANNWAYGVWARFGGNGLWYEANSHIQPLSLFFAQLATRSGKEIDAFDNQLLSYKGASTSKPSLLEAAQASAYAKMPAPNLLTFIEQQPFPDTMHQDLSKLVFMDPVLNYTGPAASNNAKIALKKGLLLFGDQLLTGGQMGVPWWRGDDRPFNVEKASPAITRFVPGRRGLAYTDAIEEVVAFMKQKNIAMLHHNYGLWYDRRRDDHERVRRMDADTWAPFYEQPFARSGEGEAWDRLSKYDLTKFNLWYWSRLKGFADKAALSGKILMHEHYFQHNILEAGAHWADSPWRPANNINDTGFPEPPAYAGDKRIFFAEQFYDISHPVRRALHRGYIRQCLDQFKDNANVLQSISAEFTGPLHFVTFWLDVVAEWEAENDAKSLICLSTTKDVQDAILENPEYAKRVAVIDIQYWAYRADGSLYAPEGGINLAPRQNARLESPGKRSFQSVYRSVSAYRLRYPDKAVIYSENGDPAWGWAVLMAGGSLAPVISTMPKGFYALAASMHPVKVAEDARYYLLENEDAEMIFYVEPGAALSHKLRAGKYIATYFNAANGKETNQEKVKTGNTPFTFLNDTSSPVIICLHKVQW